MPWISTRTSARVRRPVYRCWNRIVPKSGRCRLEALDVVFTSNFFEHLPNKDAIRRTPLEVYRCLRPGGRFIAMGPNMKYARRILGLLRPLCPADRIVDRRGLVELRLW